MIGQGLFGSISGLCDMALVAWCPSEAALENNYECILSQVGTHPDMILGDAKA